MKTKHLHQLVSNGIHRVQRGHRVLENDADFASAHLTEFLFRHFFHMVVTIECNGSPTILPGSAIIPIKE